MVSSTMEEERRRTVGVSLREEESEVDCCERRRVRMTKGVSCPWTTTWTWTIVSTCLLFILSSVHSVPMSRSLEQVDITPSESRGLEMSQLQDPSSFSSASGDHVNHQSLVHHQQLYLPSLIHPNEEDNGHLYPQSQTQSEDDSIGSNGGSGTEWETVINPHLYVLNEWMSPSSGAGGSDGGDGGIQQERRRRNAGPSLSIVNPLDVLRQRLLLEIARRRMIKSQNQIMANAEILRKVGRRRR